MIEAKVNADAVLAKLRDVAQGLGPQGRAAANRRVSIQLYAWVMDNFNVAGSNQTPAWEPLAESTLKEKERLGYSWMPLLRTGNLRQSFANFYDETQAGVRARASFGVDYAEVHEYGTDHIPARPMLPQMSEALEIALDIYDEYISGLTK